jgi:1,4-dihydroxy-2-naphthoyl-CoA synthase
MRGAALDLCRKPRDFAPVTASPDKRSDAVLARNDARGVATLTLNHPPSRNALSLAMIAALAEALGDIADDPAIRAVVIESRGPVFCSGHDLREIQAHRNDADRGARFYDDLMRACSASMQAIVCLPKPVIAAIEGVATAASLSRRAISPLPARPPALPRPALRSVFSARRRLSPSGGRSRPGMRWKWR